MFRIGGVVPSGASTGPVATIAFSIYDSEAGGTLLWQELQTVAVDNQGRYSVLLGSSNADGLPLDLFATSEPRWLATRVQGQAEQARSLLTSVPYALRAATASDADTLGGRPASDYLLTPSAASGSGATSSVAKAGANGSSAASLDAPSVNNGSAGFIGKFFNTVDLDNSALFQSGSSIGLGTTAPLDIFHSRFTNNTGSLTGLAVQNLGNTASSYSGMLFYDHTGALRQFQGYNNGTGEYRINNISPTASINFMISSASAFKIDSTGFIGLGAGTNLATSKLHMFSNDLDGVAVRGTRLNGTITAPTAITIGESLVRLEAAGYNGSAFSTPRGLIRAVSTEGWTTTANGTELEFSTTADGTTAMTPRMLIAAGGNVGIGTTSPAVQLEVAGDVRATGGNFQPLDTSSFGMRWVTTAGVIRAHIFRFSSDDRLYFTNNGAGNLTGLYIANGATSFTSTSDVRLKTDIAPITGILDKIKGIRVVGFNMFSASADSNTGKIVINHDVTPRITRDGKTIKQQIGSIAQDWIQDFPELVVEPKTADGFYGLDYDRIGVVALGAVKELNALVETKDAEIQALNARLATLEQALQTLTAHLEAQIQKR